MGVFKGTMHYTRFFVDGTLEADWIGAFEASLKLRRFVPLHEDGNDLESIGFVTAQNPFSDDISILNDSFYFDKRIVLALRHDKIRLPKIYMREQVKKKLAEQRKKLGEEPSRNTVKAIEDVVLYETRRRVFPKSQIVDFCWDVEKSQLRLFGRGESLIENFTKLFEQTFSMTLRQMTFAQSAVSQNFSLREKGQLESLVPQELYQPRVVA